MNVSMADGNDHIYDNRNFYWTDILFQKDAATFHGKFITVTKDSFFKSTAIENDCIVFILNP